LKHAFDLAVRAADSGHWRRRAGNGGAACSRLTWPYVQPTAAIGADARVTVVHLVRLAKNKRLKALLTDLYERKILLTN
jgi:hypothetical protein